MMPMMIIYFSSCDDGAGKENEEDGDDDDDDDDDDDADDDDDDDDDGDDDDVVDNDTDDARVEWAIPHLLSPPSAAALTRCSSSSPNKVLLQRRNATASMIHRAKEMHAHTRTRPPPHRTHAQKSRRQREQAGGRGGVNQMPALEKKVLIMSERTIGVYRVYLSHV